MLIKPDKDKPVFLFFPNAWKLIQEDKCPLCKEKIKKEEFDEMTRKEYTISGMCVDCQLKMFNVNTTGGFQNE
jgi:hypothetical protein